MRNTTVKLGPFQKKYFQFVLVASLMYNLMKTLFKCKNSMVFPTDIIMHAKDLEIDFVLKFVFLSNCVTNT